MNHTRLSLASLLLASLSLVSACGLEDDELLYESQVFRGAEIDAALADDPDALFFVDLRGGEVYGFDQVSPDAFANFIVQCPSMAQPLPMLDFAAHMDLDLELAQWSVQSSVPSFRSNHCREKCDANGTDCILVCDDLAAFGE